MPVTSVIDAPLSTRNRAYRKWNQLGPSFGALVRNCRNRIILAASLTTQSIARPGCANSPNDTGSSETVHEETGHVRVCHHTHRPRAVDKGPERGQHSGICDRFTLSANPANVAKALGIAEGALPPMKPRYNIAPTQLILTAGLNAGKMAAGS
jgi:hypothetical protein